MESATLWKVDATEAALRAEAGLDRFIKSFLSGQLAPGRTQELQSELLAAGIPL